MQNKSEIVGTMGIIPESEAGLFMCKKITVFILAVFLLTLVVGCKSSSQDLSEEVPENTMQEANLDCEEITDPVELEKLWQEYFYDTIATIGNTRKFKSAAEIEPLHIARFCRNKYVEEYGPESLELSGEDSLQRLFPLETVLTYAERYFNLTSLDVSQIDDSYYNREKHAFIFGVSGNRERPVHTDSNSWGIHINKVTRNSDGTITAVMERYDSYKTRRVELTKTYTLKQRQNGSLYFVSGRWDYVNNHLVSLTGDYQRFDKIEGFDGNMSEIIMLGENKNRLIFAYTPYEKKRHASLMLVNPETMKVEKKLELNDNFTLTEAGITGEKIVVRLKDRIITFDKNLKPLEEIPLPEAIKEKIKREPIFGDDGFRDSYFGGYDISKDLKRIVYANKKGIKLFNLVDGDEKLLCPTVPISGTNLYSYHSNPRFIADDQKVISTRLGYETAMGYTLCSLTEGIFKNYDISSDDSSSGFIRYDTGLMEIRGIFTEETQSTEYKLLYLDFKTGDVKKIKLENVDNGGMRGHNSYIGQNYAAFMTYRFDNDYANNMSFINLFDLKKLEVKSEIVSVKAAQTHIMGVLADGRVVFWYNLNPSENGVGITAMPR